MVQRKALKTSPELPDPNQKRSRPPFFSGVVNPYCYRNLIQSTPGQSRSPGDQVVDPPRSRDTIGLVAAGVSNISKSK